MRKTIIAGRVFVVGNNIDTDQIIPAQYLNLVPTIAAEYEKLGTHAFSGLPDNYPPFVENGAAKSSYSIIIAGRNFGCGSSREHAPIALGAAGVKAVVAKSYARIFFRNVISTGEFFPCEFEPDAGHAPQNMNFCGLIKTGDAAEIEITDSRAAITCNGKTCELKPLGAAADVIESGGLFGYARKTGMIGARSNE